MARFTLYTWNTFLENWQEDRTEYHDIRSVLTAYKKARLDHLAKIEDESGRVIETNQPSKRTPPPQQPTLF